MYRSEKSVVFQHSFFLSLFGLFTFMRGGVIVKIFYQFARYDNWMQSICDLGTWIDVEIERQGDAVIIDFRVDDIKA